jgi:hypothetical protein
VRLISRVTAAAATAVAATVVFAGAPAWAAADPAVTGCSFTPLYATYVDGQLADLQYYYPRNTALTVTGGDGDAWQVTVNRNGEQGWMAADCVRFLA